MIKIYGTTISLTRGDTFTAVLQLAIGDTPYTPTENDEIRFALKHDRFNAPNTEYEDDTPLLMVQIPYDTMILQIGPGARCARVDAVHARNATSNSLSSTADRFVR